ncbi:iron-siderophore ABC transporter substrate-binding protein [Paenibacillus oenotherae]|uniref:Iron-siderophore ABC transporter substrate-binding protein n=1 Tax=Paenibacillus oenotherae TaxID=1435645 RepID=A0ABS7D4B4_9BACL|nr:iron-siderophore ABC transporter substrate-binding protein [Paenibacillus oenotherae]MBW7474764.1 iron-siderophore ABC transporter substrate-binding protein [Paenibacillus oenotherae]
MYRSRKALVALAAIMLVVFVIAGCGANKNEESAAKGNQQETTGGKDNTSSTGTAEDADTVRVIDHAMGKTAIKGTPTRIVTLYQGATDVAVALGVKPVGVVDSWAEQPMYKYLRADLEGVQHVGLETQPNLEEIAKLKPDLIIATKLRHEEIYEQLSQIAPTVTHETVYKFKDTVELMGKAMNKQDEAAKLLADWDKRVADFKVKIKEKLGDQWPLEQAILNFRADHARVYVTGYAGDILEELGFVRPAAHQAEVDKGTVVLKLTSKESIPSMNSKLFFIFKFDAEEDAAVEKTFKEWTSHPLWRDLDAVKNNKVYMVNEVTWNNAGGILSANNMLDEVYEHFELAK